MMTEMTNYLKDVAELECQLYTQNKLKNRLKAQIDKLGRAKYYEKPKLEEGNWDKEGIGIVLIVAFLVGVFLMIKIAELMSDFINLSIIWIFSFIPLGFITVVLPWYKINEARERKYQEQKYQERVEEYNIAINRDLVRVGQENIVKDNLMHQFELVSSSTKETETTIKSIYDLNIIHPKYRNLVAICSFYDYFDTGICNTLTGPGGAYDVFERELRFRRIETKLDVIISKLDEIIRNQQYIAELMRESNNTLHRIEQQNKSIIGNLNDIKENAALTEYNTRCISRSTAIMEHIAVYHHLNNL